MRRIVVGSLVALLVALVALPAALGRLTGGPAAASVPAVNDEGPDSMRIKVYHPATRQVVSMPLGDYLQGVVAAEMPNSFEDEALKAQFVVARTYAVRRMQQFTGKGGCPLEPRADVCADPRTGQDFISKEGYAGKHGKANAEALWKRLSRLQALTDGQVLRYQGEFIDPLYHSVSGTRTEDVASYFKQPLPYLKSVDDQWGADSPKLKATQTLDPAQLAEALEKAGKPVAVPALATAVKAGQQPVQIVSRTATGRVGTVKVLGVTMTGREFREALGLDSNNFTVSLKNGRVVVNTVGYGHGVGMSQYGANGMAKAGKTYTEILMHYYTGVTLSAIYGE
jgi:stage II sporulation protein D